MENQIRIITVATPQYANSANSNQARTQCRTLMPKRTATRQTAHSRRTQQRAVVRLAQKIHAPIHSKIHYANTHAQLTMYSRFDPASTFCPPRENFLIQFPGSLVDTVTLFSPSVGMRGIGNFVGKRGFCELQRFDWPSERCGSMPDWRFPRDFRWQRIWLDFRIFMND